MGLLFRTSRSGRIRLRFINDFFFLGVRALFRRFLSPASPQCAPDRASDLREAPLSPAARLELLRFSQWPPFPFLFTILPLSRFHAPPLKLYFFLVFTLIQMLFSIQPQVSSFSYYDFLGKTFPRFPEIVREFPFPECSGFPATWISLAVCLYSPWGQVVQSVFFCLITLNFHVGV